jgi:hypothetical protein
MLGLMSKKLYKDDPNEAFISTQDDKLAKM